MYQKIANYMSTYTVHTNTTGKYAPYISE